MSRLALPFSLGLFAAFAVIGLAAHFAPARPHPGPMDRAELSRLVETVAGPAITRRR